MEMAATAAAFQFRLLFGYHKTSEQVNLVLNDLPCFKWSTLTKTLLGAQQLSYAITNSVALLHEAHQVYYLTGLVIFDSCNEDRQQHQKPGK